MTPKLQDRAANLYDADFYAWVEEQAARLRARQFDALDLDNLIEQVAELAGSKLSAVLNSARVVMAHLLKFQHSPSTDPTQQLAGKRARAPAPGADRSDASHRADSRHRTAAAVRDGARRRSRGHARSRRGRRRPWVAPDLSVYARPDHWRLVAVGRPRWRPLLEPDTPKVAQGSASALTSSRRARGGPARPKARCDRRRRSGTARG